MLSAGWSPFLCWTGKNNATNATAKSPRIIYGIAFLHWLYFLIKLVEFLSNNVIGGAVHIKMSIPGEFKMACQPEKWFVIPCRMQLHEGNQDLSGPAYTE